MCATRQVAVVDDDPSICRALSRLCASAGWSASTFGSAEEFLKVSAARVFDCLILDLQLPGMSGLDLHSQLMGVELHIPVIFISAHDDEPFRESALALGALAFLGKPFDTQYLLDLIEGVFAGD